MLNNLEDKIIKKIEKEKLKPLSRSFFVFKKIIFWILTSIFLLFAGLSLSVMFLIIKHGDWDIYHFLGSSPGTFFLKAFPYFWLLGVLVFLILTLIKTKKADGTYAYPFIYQSIIGMLIVTILASGFYLSGMSQKTEAYLSSNKLYRKANYIRSSWENPEKGLLAGTLKIKNNVFILKDFSEIEWVLVLPENNLTGKELLIDNDKIKIIGKINTESQKNEFIVQEIRSWKCGCPHCAKMEGSCNGCSDENSCNSENQCQIYKMK
ncbi:MAG: hypothetical protein WCY43_01590 [Patescibacteria group bacterium]